MGTVTHIHGAGTAPGFAHAAGVFLLAHTTAAAWSPGTGVKYRQTLAILAGQLTATAPPAAAGLAQLDTPAGAAALAAAFTAAFGALAPATRARHLAALRSALAWWRDRGWLTSDPAAGWPRPKSPWTPPGH
jgi:site-specific recombinase XerC